MKFALIFTIIFSLAYVSYAACPNRDPLGLSDPGFLEKLGCTLEKAWDDTTDAVQSGVKYVKNGFKSDEDKVVDDAKDLLSKITPTEKPWYEKIFKK